MAKEKKERRDVKQRNLFKRWNIALKKDKNTKQVNVFPGKEDPKDEKRMLPIEFPTNLQKAWEFFQSDLTITNSENNYENRINRYKELEFMIYNDGYMHTSALIYTNETTQADEQNRIVGIKGETKEVENYFYQWTQDIGITPGVLQDTAWDLSVYADHFWMNSFDIDTDKGIIEIVPVDPYECSDRIEFQGIRVKKAMAENSSFSGYVNRYNNLKKLAKMFEDEKNQATDIAGWYKSYLFGFSFGNPKDGDSIITPPWYVNHFRRFASRSEFFPFGRPLFIGSLARYKSYKTTEMLIDMARVASFPKEVLNITGSPEMTEEELTNKVNEVRQLYKNITANSRNEDEFGIGEMIFTVEGLTDYKLFESRINLDQIGDLDAKRKDLMLSTGIPLGYIDSNDRAWGQSGQSLLQQSKIVARNVYSNQTAILDQLTALFKFHLFLTNKFKGEDTQFELYMNYPVIEESSDRMRIKSDSIRLATDILSNLGEQLGLERGEALPSSIVQDVFGKYSFLDMEEISNWVSEFQKTKEITENIDEEKTRRLLEFSSKISLKENEYIKERYDHLIEESDIREIYFKAKKENGFSEGYSGGKHYYSSFSANNNNINLVKDLQKDRIKD